MILMQLISSFFNKRDIATYKDSRYEWDYYR